jgi:hypothetical protein
VESNRDSNTVIAVSQVSESVCASVLACVFALDFTRVGFVCVCSVWLLMLVMTGVLMGELICVSVRVFDVGFTVGVRLSVPVCVRVCANVRVTPLLLVLLVWLLLAFDGYK